VTSFNAKVHLLFAQQSKAADTAIKKLMEDMSLDDHLQRFEEL